MGKRPAPADIVRAVTYLRRCGERVEPTGLGCWRINGGEVQQPQAVIAYAQELMEFDR